MGIIDNFFSLFKKGKSKSFQYEVNPVSSAEFKKYVTKYFAPKLREHGWQGSGFKYFKKTDEPYIYVLTFYASRYGGKFYVEIGIHFDFIELVNIGFDYKKIDTAYLDIRKRLSPNNEIDYWWPFGSNEDDNIKIIENVWEVYFRSGQKFFSQFKNFPAPFSQIKIDDLITEAKNDKLINIPLPGPIRTAWLLSHLHHQIGNKTKVKEFAEFGLSQIKGRGGSGLIPDFKNLINQNM